MEHWRIFAAVCMAALIFPAIQLMNQLEDLRRKGKKDEIRKKEAQLKWVVRLIILGFVLILGATMYLHYIKLAGVR